MTDSTCFKLSIENNVAHIVLNRPEAFNAMPRAFWNELPAIVLLGIWFLVQIGGALMASGESASSGGVALFAHIGGFVAGVVVGLLLRAGGLGRGPRPLRSTDRIGVG